MAKFRAKPVVIEAYQFNAALNPQPRWLQAAVLTGDFYYQGGNKPYLTILMIKTLEGSMRADEGDWIIHSVDGEIYACKPDIFEATYEPVE